MPLLFRDGKLLDFGPSEYLPGEGLNRTMRIDGRKPSEVSAGVRLQAPTRPGVYGMIDGDEQLIYVGKAKNLRTRLLSYFRNKGRPRKAGRIVSHARSIIWEVVPSEFASLLRELELIRRWRPRFNVQGQPLRRRLTFVCLGRAPAPYIYLSRKVTGNFLAAFGPITASDNAIEAVRRLNDLFLLRDCPEPQEMTFANQADLFPGERSAGCLRLEIGTCLGPCAGVCSRRDYQVQVRRAKAFLAGDDLTPLAELKDEMQAAAEASQYERAAGLRDRLAALQWLADRLERSRKAQREMSFIYPVAGFDGSTTWYLIHGARVIGAMQGPHDNASRKAAREKIDAAYRCRSELLDSYEHADGMMIVMLWFRKYVGERARCLSSEEALATLR